MSVINSLVKKLRRIDKEYFLLFIVVIIFSFLIFCSTVKSQVSPETITMTTFFPAPFGEFNVLQARRIYDLDNTTYRLDPEGDSRFISLLICRGIRLDAPIYSSNVYTINFSNGNARFGDLYAQTIHMLDSGPPTQRAGGKYVYDISEGIYAEGCQKGDVVLIGDQEDCVLVKAASKFDTRVAGVISENPKIYMGQGEGTVPLALAGIVKCKATTENGPIKRGDLLVSSSLAGHAMRAHPSEVKPGMLIGKALQPLEDGEGKIFILVNK